MMVPIQVPHVRSHRLLSCRGSFVLVLATQAMILCCSTSRFFARRRLDKALFGDLDKQVFCSPIRKPCLSDQKKRKTLLTKSLARLPRLVGPPLPSSFCRNSKVGVRSFGCGTYKPGSKDLDLMLCIFAGGGCRAKPDEARTVHGKPRDHPWHVCNAAGRESNGYRGGFAAQGATLAS